MEETNMRIPLGRIKDDDDKRKHEEVLNIYLKEMGWLSNSKNTKSKMLEKIKKNLEQIPVEDRNENEERKLYNESVKKSLLMSGEYEPRLFDNIRAEIFMIQEYELRKKYPTLGKALLGWSKGEEDAKKLLGYIVLRETGRITMPERMNVNYQCLSELIEQYDASFVDTDIEQIKEELEKSKSVALVPYDDRAFFKFADEAANNLTREVNDRIKENEVKKSNDYFESRHLVNGANDKTKPKNVGVSHEKITKEKE